jgi:predicted metal-binding membrane protein
LSQIKSVQKPSHPMNRAVTFNLWQNRALTFTALTVVVVLAWTYLGLHPATAMPNRWGVGYVAIVFIMWAVMMVAMMLPSAAKVVLLTATLDGQERLLSALRRTGEFAVGYLSVWLAFGLAATAAQWALDKAGLLSTTMITNDHMLAGSLLVYAGIYQWGPVKQACLIHCRTPQEFLARHWERDGPFGTGLRHGLFCFGCCWMLMALLFVGGVMNVGCIAVISVAILVEKTLPWGIWASRVIGTALIAGGAITLATLG